MNLHLAEDARLSVSQLACCDFPLRLFAVENHCLRHVGDFISSRTLFPILLAPLCLGL